MHEAQNFITHAKRWVESLKCEIWIQLEQLLKGFPAENQRLSELFQIEWRSRSGFIFYLVSFIDELTIWMKQKRARRHFVLFFPSCSFFFPFFCNFTVINYSPKITFSPSVNQTPEECTMRRCTVRPFFCAAFAQNMSSSRFDISSHQQDFETKLIFWIDRVDFLCLASFGLQNRKRPMNREVVNLIQCETLKATIALQWISSTSSCDRMSWKLSQYSLPQLTFYLIDERPITRRKSKRNSTLLDNKTIIFFASALFNVLSVIETLWEAGVAERVID